MFDDSHKPYPKLLEPNSCAAKACHGFVEDTALYCRWVLACEIPKCVFSLHRAWVGEVHIFVLPGHGRI